MSSNPTKQESLRTFLQTDNTPVSPNITAFDIETIPRSLTPAELKIYSRKVEEEYSNLTPPGNFKKEEAINEWYAKKFQEKQEVLANLMAGSALDAHFSQIVLFSWADKLGKHSLLYKLGEDYAAYLAEIYTVLTGTKSQLVGFCSSSFDVPVIMAQFAIHRVPIVPSLKWASDISYWYSYRDAFGKRQLKNLKQLVSIFYPELMESYPDITGADVHKLWAMQEYDKIKTYGEWDAYACLKLTELAFSLDPKCLAKYGDR